MRVFTGNSCLRVREDRNRIVFLCKWVVVYTIILDVINLNNVRLMMVRIIVMLISILLLGQGAFAQDAMPSANEVMANMRQTLHLTDDQARAIRPIVEHQLEQLIQIQQQFSGLNNQVDMNQAIDQVKINNRQLISQYLTVDQIKIWEAKLISN